MREILIWWKSLSSEEKKSIMKDHKIEKATFHFIKDRYLESIQIK